MISNEQIEINSMNDSFSTRMTMIDCNLITWPQTIIDHLRKEEMKSNFTKTNQNLFINYCTIIVPILTCIKLMSTLFILNLPTYCCWASYNLS